MRDDVLICLHGFTTWTVVRVEGARSEPGGVFAREGVACEKADTRRDDWSGEGSHLAGLPAPGTMVEVCGLPASLLASWRWPPPGRWSGAEP